MHKWIVALVGLNLALVGGIVIASHGRDVAPGVPGENPANAQVIGGGTDYLMMTGSVGRDDDAVYILELNSQRLRAWRFNRTKNRLEAQGGIDLGRDFRQEAR